MLKTLGDSQRRCTAFTRPGEKAKQPVPYVRVTCAKMASTWEHLFLLDSYSNGRACKISHKCSFLPDVEWNRPAWSSSAAGPVQVRLAKASGGSIAYEQRATGFPSIMEYFSFFCFGSAVDTNLIAFLPRARRHPSNALQPIAWTPISFPKGSKFSPEVVIMSPSCCSKSFGEGSLYVKVLWSVSADLFLPYAHFAFPLGNSMHYNLPE